VAFAAKGQLAAFVLINHFPGNRCGLSCDFGCSKGNLDFLSGASDTVRRAASDLIDKANFARLSRSG
jgi:hypothetical protein